MITRFEFTSLVAALVLVMMWACSDEGTTPAADVTIESDTAFDAGLDSEVTVTPDAGSDYDVVETDDVASDALDAADVPIIDPCTTDETGETTYYEPQEVEVPGSIHGCIGLPDDYWGDPDQDFFTFEGTAGTVLRVNIDGIGADLSPIVSVHYIGDAEGGSDFYRQLDELTPSQTRQAFLPYDGTYLIQVNDLQNLIYLYYYEGEAVGGSVGYEYDLSWSLETVSPPGELLPYDHAWDDLASGNGIRIIDFTAFEAGVMVADIDAQGLETPSELDAVLVLMSGDYSEVLAWNEDGDADPEVNDPYLLHLIDENERVRLVIDFIVARETNAHTIDVSIVDPSVEREPNDSNLTAWPLDIGEDADTAIEVTGNFAEPVVSEDPEDPGDIPDLDWYALGALSEGDAVEITMGTTTGSEAQPAVIMGMVASDYFGAYFDSLWYGEPGPDGTTRIEGTAWADGFYYAVAVDKRNLKPSGAPEDWILEGVGGENFGYTIKAVTFERTTTDITLPFVSEDASLSQVGEIDWLQFSSGEAPGEDEEVPAQFLMISLSMDGEGVVPLGYLFNRTQYGDDYEPLEDPALVGSISNGTDEGVLFSEIPRGVEYGLAVWNAAAWPTTELPYDLEVELVELPEVPVPTVESDEFPNTTGAATTVSAPGESYVGLLGGTGPDDADHDVFSIDLEAGDVLIAYTFSPFASTTRLYECGDGYLDWDEACEDGNTDDGDGCSADCMTVEPELTNRCGDRIIVAEAEETCDDGDDNSDDPLAACNEECQTNSTVDTMMALTGPDIEEEDGLVDDDGGDGVFSRIVHITSPEGAGTYFIDVYPYTSGGSGDFEPYCSEGVYQLHITVLGSD